MPQARQNSILHESALDYMPKHFPGHQRAEIEIYYRKAMDYECLGITAVRVNDLYEVNQDKVLGILNRLDRTANSRYGCFISLPEDGDAWCFTAK